MKILSIDVGIINLGYVFAEIHSVYIKYKNLSLKTHYNQENDFDINVIECNKIDITNIRHSSVKQCECKLHHDRCIPDYLDHFIQEHVHLFESADIIIIERQPPVGITNVQDLLFKLFRNKVLLISPNSVHKYFKLSKDYDIRKIESEDIAKKYLLDFSNFNNNTRKHDISDAMLMIIYYYKLNKIKNEKKNDLSNLLDFEQFRFKILQN